MKILLVSHGDFAKGLCSTMTDFFGADQITSASVTMENGTRELAECAQKFLEQCQDGEQVVICSDLLGGSANQTVFPFMSRPNTYLIAGMNLPLVMLLSMETEVTETSVNGIIAQAREGIVLVNGLNFGAADADDE